MHVDYPSAYFLFYSILFIGMIWFDVFLSAKLQCCLFYGTSLLATVSISQ